MKGGIISRNFLEESPMNIGYVFSIHHYPKVLTDISKMNLQWLFIALYSVGFFSDL